MSASLATASAAVIVEIVVDGVLNLASLRSRVIEASWACALVVFSLGLPIALAGGQSLRLRGKLTFKNSLLLANEIAIALSLLALFWDPAFGSLIILPIFVAANTLAVCCWRWVFRQLASQHVHA